MKTRINVDEQTKKLNEFRMSHLNKTFTHSELSEALYSLGFNKVVSVYLMHQFPSEKMGTSKLYSVSKEPIHKNIVASAYNKQNKQRSDCYKKLKDIKEETDETRIAKLQASGYIIKRCVGIDLEKLQKNFPEVYRACLKYENV